MTECVQPYVCTLSRKKGRDYCQVCGRGWAVCRRSVTGPSCFKASLNIKEWRVGIRGEWLTGTGFNRIRTENQQVGLKDRLVVGEWMHR